MRRRTALALPTDTTPVPSTEGLVDGLLKLITGAPEHQTAADRRKLNDYSGDVIRQIKDTYLNDAWLDKKSMTEGDISAGDIIDHTWYAKSDDPVASIDYITKALRQFMKDFSRTMNPFANAVGKQTIQVRNSQAQFAAQTFEKIYPIVMGIAVPKLDGPVVLGGYAFKPGQDALEISEAWLKRHSNQVQTPPKKDKLPALSKEQVKKVAEGIIRLLESARDLSGVVYNSTPFVDTDDGGWGAEEVHDNSKLSTLINHIDQPTAMGEWYGGMTVLSAIAFERWIAQSVK